MRIELPPSVTAQLAGPLADCANNGELSPHVLAGQVVRGSFDDGGTDRLFLLLARISPTSARKIKALLEKERAKQGR